MKIKAIFIILALMAGAVLLWFASVDKTPLETPLTAPPKTPSKASLLVYGDLVKVTRPMSDEVVSSPLIVEGEARGFWYFEASFPVRLLDTNGKELAIAVAQAQGEWMTENYVSFKATLEFTKPATDTGVLVLEKDNPSGLPENADEFRIPIQFNK